MVDNLTMETLRGQNVVGRADAICNANFERARARTTVKQYLFLQRFLRAFAASSAETGDPHRY